jgi:hypothetical protein
VVVKLFVNSIVLDAQHFVVPIFLNDFRADSRHARQQSADPGSVIPGQVREHQLSEQGL